MLSRSLLPSSSASPCSLSQSAACPLPTSTTTSHAVVSAATRRRGVHSGFADGCKCRCTQHCDNSEQELRKSAPSVSKKKPAVSSSSSSSEGEEELRKSTPTVAKKIPNQAETLFAGSAEEVITLMPETTEEKSSTSDLDYLTELLAIQQNDGPKDIGFLGTRNMGVTHQKLVEILSYAYASAGNHIYTSGSIGTNAAVIKGALRANMPDKLTVILPQSLSKQPSESQELLQQVKNWVEMPQNDHLSLLDASRICNRRIISHVQQIIVFAFHDSRLLLETCHNAKEQRKIVTMFYLD